MDGGHRTLLREFSKTPPESTVSRPRPSRAVTANRLGGRRTGRRAGLRTHGPRAGLAHLLAVASQIRWIQCLMTAVVPEYRCGAVPDSHRVPSCLCLRCPKRRGRTRCDRQPTDPRSGSRRCPPTDLMIMITMLDRDEREVDVVRCSEVRGAAAQQVGGDHGQWGHRGGDRRRAQQWPGSACGPWRCGDRCRLGSSGSAQGRGQGRGAAARVRRHRRRGTRTGR